MKVILKIYATAFFLIIPALSTYSNVTDDALVRYYSKVLEINLNHLMELTKSLNDLTNEPTFKKEYLETELIRINEEIEHSNQDIDAMMEYIPEENLKKIEKYLTSIDNHLAQLYIDIETLRSSIKNNKEIDIPKYTLDMYNQMKEAKTVDQVEIYKIQNHATKN